MSESIPDASPEVAALDNGPRTPEEFDTPTQRAAINMLDVDTLDVMLTAIRERRLVAVKKLEKAAKVRADEVRLEAFLKFQAQYKRAKRAVEKLDELMEKTEAVVHRARLLALAAELEVVQDMEPPFDENGTYTSTGLAEQHP